MSNSLSSFGGFCDLLGLSQLQSYLVSRNVHQIEDWGAYPLDDEGKALKARIDNASNVSVILWSYSKLLIENRISLSVLRKPSWGLVSKGLSLDR